ncbi:hypothetical protein [Pseudomonas fluorescens group sp. PF-69]
MNGSGCDCLGQGTYMTFAHIYSYSVASPLLLVFKQGMNRFILTRLVAVLKLSVIAIWQPGTEVTA